MPECPECGAEVPADGRFCPSCGSALENAGGQTRREPKQEPTRREPQSGGRGRTQTEYPSREEPPRQRQPPRREGVRRRTRSANPEDHKLLLGSVSALSVVGLLSALNFVLTPSRSAEQILDATQGAGMEMERGFAEQVVLTAGVVGIALSLLVLGLTVWNYRNKQLQSRYFWVLIGVGIVGFLFASNIFLMLLAGFGIYGLVSVTD